MLSPVAPPSRPVSTIESQNYDFKTSSKLSSSVIGVRIECVSPAQIFGSGARLISRFPFSLHDFTTKPPHFRHESKVAGRSGQGIAAESISSVISCFVGG